MAFFIPLGFLFFGFAIVDVLGRFWGYDLTGVSWSPLAAGVIGTIFTSIGSGKDDDDAKE